jgi:choline dehydrogenase-like flavoprotein
MLSGIGPAAELTKYGIEVVQDIPYIGKGLRDHLGAFHVFTRANGTTDRPSFYGNASALQPAREEWFKDRTGPLTTFSCTNGMGYFKAQEIYKSAEFKALPRKEQRFMLQPTTPSWEALTVCSRTPQLDCLPAHH